MSDFKSNQHVKIKDEALPIIADQMAEDLSHLHGVVGILHKSSEDSKWDWYFDTETYGGIPVLDSEIEAVQP